MRERIKEKVRRKRKENKHRKIGNGVGRSSFWEPAGTKKRMRHVSTSDSEAAHEQDQEPRKKEPTQTFTTNALRTAMVEGMLQQHAWIDERCAAQNLPVRYPRKVTRRDFIRAHAFSRRTLKIRD